MTLLTQDQEQAKLAIFNFLNNDSETCFVLEGAAGTGKTWLIRHVEEQYTKIGKVLTMTGTYTQRTWIYTATTHKASHALAHATQATTQTIHSLLKLCLRPDYSTGTYSLTRSYKEPLVEKQIIVIDEASYIDYQLLEAILEFTKNCKIIFMGDPNQLTPIGLNHSPVFKQGFPTVHLNQIVRQQDSHPLTPILKDFRNFISGKTSKFPVINTVPEVVHLDTDDFNKCIENEFDADWDKAKCRLLAWRNKTVNKYNKFLFEKNTNRKVFAKGDIVISNHSVEGIKTDEELEIKSVRAATELDCKGHWCDVENDRTGATVFVPAKSSDYKKYKTKYLRENNTQAVQTIMDDWADLRPAYACTINKAQGSTYNKVFIDLSDFKSLKDHNHLARLLYVAMSRAKYQVIFTGDLV